MKLEVWKDIQDYPNYQVSNYGNIKSKERFTNVGIKNQKQCFRKERLLKQQKDHQGYMQVILYNEKGYKHFKVHRLVANAFLENKYNKPTIDHIDRNKENNNINNLRYADYREQIENRDINIELIKENMRKLGKKGLGNRKQKIKQYDLDGNFIKEWTSTREASRSLNISETSISNCVNGNSSNAGGFVWKR